MRERETQQDGTRDEKKELDRGVALKVAYLMMISSKKRVASERQEWREMREAS